MTAEKLPKKRTAKLQASDARSKAELPVLAFANAVAFERWLRAHHASSPGLWLRLMKKASTTRGVSYQEALDSALAWGWIDGQTKAHDEHSWLRKFVPRGARSTWSKINRDKALKLIDSGRMQPSGLTQVELARRDGRWQAAYDSPRNAVPPPDFAAALADSPRALAFFETISAANRYAVLFRIQTPKKAETRARKIRELIEMLERGETIHS
jgi:uncharacterized protein YdeI (YjbR/CyaY-like superfamily)